ncbi:MAG: FHA domain-containing protein [Planctomycetes bacterium]|nr:FHA domain-containing protein [Planctomycetota bacterium]
MSQDKITVSWDELNTPQVDVRIKQQDMISRVQEHYQQQVAPPALPAAAAVPQRQASVWYNSLFYMAVFGFIGGVAAWISGEFVFALIPNRLEEWEAARIEVRDITQRENRGELTEAQAVSLVEQVTKKYSHNPYVQIICDNLLSNGEKERLTQQRLTKDAWRNYFQQLIWFSSIGIPLAFCLAVAEPAVGRNWRASLICGSVGLLLGLLGGVVVGLFINGLYHAVGGGQGASMTQQILARGLGWAVLGFFLAVAPGLVLRSWKRFGIGLAGGLAGGLIGGLLFDPIGIVTGSAGFSRFVGIVGIGLLAGVGTGLIEKAAKTGWLRVVSGLIAGKQFVVYRNPTFIGSSPQCEVYLFKDPRVGPRHAAIHTIPGGYEIEDLGSPTGTFINGQPTTRTRLRNHDLVQIGGTEFQFQEKARTAL